MLTLIPHSSSTDSLGLVSWAGHQGRKKKKTQKTLDVQSKAGDHNTFDDPGNQKGSYVNKTAVKGGAEL